MTIIVAQLSNHQALVNLLSTTHPQHYFNVGGVLWRISVCRGVSLELWIVILLGPNIPEDLYITPSDVRMSH